MVELQIHIYFSHRENVAESQCLLLFGILAYTTFFLLFSFLKFWGGALSILHCSDTHTLLCVYVVSALSIILALCNSLSSIKKCCCFIYAQYAYIGTLAYYIVDKSLYENTLSVHCHDLLWDQSMFFSQGYNLDMK